MGFQVVKFRQVEKVMKWRINRVNSEILCNYIEIILDWNEGLDGVKFDGVE